MGAARLILKSLWYWAIKVFKGLISKPGLTAICLFGFCAALTWFYYTCANVKMDTSEAIAFRDKWRNLILGAGSLNIFIFLLMGVKCNMQKQLLIVYSGVIVWTYAIIIGVYWFIIDQPYQFMLAMDCGTLVVTLFILISGIRHDMLEH